MPYINCRSVESDAVEGGCRRVLELCGGEKVKAGTDGEDGEGQMLGRKRQTRRKKRQRERETNTKRDREGWVEDGHYIRSNLWLQRQQRI